jgi:diguanylate cyclase (GGDEF)-like protein
MWQAIYRLLSLIALWGVLQSPLAAQPWLPSGPAAGSPKICILPAQPTDVAATMFAAVPRFDCDPKQTKYGRGNFWVAFDPQLQQQPADAPLVVRMNSVWQDNATLYFRYADGVILARYFTSRDTARLMSIGAFIEVSVPKHAAPLADVLMHVTDSQNMRGVAPFIVLTNKRESHVTQLFMTSMYSALTGLCIALIFFNLALWSVLRYRFQVIYCAMVTSFLGYAFSSSGVIMMVAGGLDNNDRLRINYIMLSLAAISGLCFIAGYFGHQIVSAKLWVWIKRFIICQMVITLVFSLFGPWHIRTVDRLYFSGFSAMLLLVVPILFNAWRHKSPHIRLFIVAWAPMLLTTFLRSMHGLGFLQYNFWLENSSFLSLGAESMMSSILIASRIRVLSEERDRARAEQVVTKRLANTDSLTGLLNRRAFLEHAVGREGVYRLMLVDIDHFKKINDTVGHVVGDDVLRDIAALIQLCRPPGSLAVRLGGEEFALLIPIDAVRECPPGLFLEQMRTHKWPCDLHVTASLGYTDGTIATDEDWSYLYRQADTALYRAKQDGRDRVVCATPLARTPKPRGALKPSAI